MQPASPFPCRRLTWPEAAGILATAIGAGVAAAALLGASPAAHAASNNSTTVAIVRGDLTATNHVDRSTVRLEAGRDYAFQISTDTVTVKLYDPAGHLAFEVVSEASEDHGTEYRANLSGYYTVRISSAEEAGYYIVVRRDCATSPALTRCGMQLDNPTGERVLDWPGDMDASRVALSGGVPYVLKGSTPSPHNYGLFLEWTDLAGKVLAERDCLDQVCELPFTPPSSGTYAARFVSANDEAETTYSAVIERR